MNMNTSLRVSLFLVYTFVQHCAVCIWFFRLETGFKVVTNSLGGGFSDDSRSAARQCRLLDGRQKAMLHHHLPSRSGFDLIQKEAKKLLHALQRKDFAVIE